jgi:GNAT superfamily N-acetyltransferase
MTLIVRPAIAADMPTILRFNTALAFETEGRTLDANRLRNGVDSVLTDPEKGRYFIAEEHGRSVGQVLITLEWSDWRNAYFWWLQNVYVMERARGRGVFTALYNHLETLAKSEGACGMRLYVARANSAAQASYYKSGMMDSGYVVFEIDRSSAVGGTAGDR